MGKHICFLMPAVGYAPSGGFKVVFEYANRLANDGFQISIVFPAVHFYNTLSPQKKVKAIIRYLLNYSPKRYTPYNWFDLDRRIRLFPVWDLRESNVPAADIYIATAVQTAVYLNEYKNITAKHKFYFIQGFETWALPEEKVLETYTYPMHKVTIAPWLKGKIESVGGKVDLIYNGFDFNYFRKEINYADKNKYCITMLYHPMPEKGCKDAFEALQIVKNKFPKLQVNLFGFPKQPKDLPDWINYYQQPDKKTHNRLYNEAAIFINASHGEGFCLTPPEAMQCGCAVACTDIEGFKVVCQQGVTALLSPVKDPLALANNIERLITNNSLRYKLADNGNKYIQQFTWEKAYSKLKNLIESSVKE